MEQPYLNLTSETMMQSISRKALWNVIKNFLIIVFFIWFFSGLTIEALSNFSEYWFFLFTTPAWVLCFYFPGKAIRKHFHIMKSGEQHEMFRQFGSPEEIVSVLSDPSNTQVLDSSLMILTKAYLMRKGDFITYTPLEAIAIMYVRHTSGRGAHLELAITLIDGTSVNYYLDSKPFCNLFKRQEQLTEVIEQHCAQYAPHIRHTYNAFPMRPM